MIKRIDLEAKKISIQKKEILSQDARVEDLHINMDEFTKRLKDIVKQDAVANMVHPNDYISELAIEIKKEAKHGI